MDYQAQYQKYKALADAALIIAVFYFICRWL